MVSSETSCNDGVTITANKQSINDTVLAKDKQLPVKTLSDVHNRDSDAATKVSGNKRLAPEPPSGFSFYHALDHTHGNEHIMNARRRFELELGGGKKLRHTDTLVKFSDSRQSHNSLGEHARKTTQPMTNSIVSSQDNLSDGPSAPSFLRRKYGSNMEVTHVDSVKPTVKGHDSIAFEGGSKMEVTHVDSVKPTVKCHDSIAFEGYDDLQWRERLERLQKRAIELTIEEGIELQRMKCMNILGTSFLPNSLWHQHLQARK